MTIGYSQKFPHSGLPTLFREKIAKSHMPLDQYIDWGLKMTEHNEKSLTHFFNTLHPKDHTIRCTKHIWTPKDVIHHVYGNRTKNRKCWLVSKCTGSQKIVVINQKVTASTSSGTKLVGNKQSVYIDNRLLKDGEIEVLAKKDGFESIDDFFAWFSSDYVGQIIHWTNFRY